LGAGEEDRLIESPVSMRNPGLVPSASLAADRLGSMEVEGEALALNRRMAAAVEAGVGDRVKLARMLWKGLLRRRAAMLDGGRGLLDRCGLRA
jgi:hypothetical protein